MGAMLHALRLCLLLLNLYGTFKAIKPPPLSQRSARNGQGPSGRAIQLRKREMKSRLAVWVVWAIYSILERPFDRTIGFLTPFYNEFKCTILLFLIVSRSHGAEAIFLHLIHPLVRPYVPAVDNILATLQSLFDLVTLLLFVPVEYVLHRWHQWNWNWFWNSNNDPSSNGRPDGSDPEDREEDQRRLRPRKESQQVTLREADRQAQAILHDIENAQDRVRMRTRSQLSAQNNVRTQPVRQTRNIDPQTVRLRTRKRVLDQANSLPEQVKHIPGSRSTGVHHIDPTTIALLARSPPPPPQLSFPKVPTSQLVTFPSSPIRTPTPPSSSHSSHEIWYPPHSTSDSHKRQSLSPNASLRTPSPIYPPLPSAYRFTPRRSDPPAPPPRMTPPDLVTPTPRRVSTDGISRGTVDPYEGMYQFPGRSSQAGPSTSAPFVEPSIHSHHSHEHSHEEAEIYFHPALDPSFQTMDVDMETLSTRDGSSANEEAMEGQDEIRLGPHDMTDPSAKSTKESRGSSRDPVSRITRSRHQVVVPTETLRHSTRMRSDRSPSVGTDEFGFTIRQDTIALKVPTVDSTSVSSFGSVSLAAGQSTKKKPLARTKPAIRPTQEEASGDEENVKKKRKLRPSVVEGEPRTSARSKPEVSSLGGNTRLNTGDARKKITVQHKIQGSESSEGGLKVRQVGTRAIRAPVRKPLSAQTRPNVNKKDKGK